MTHRGPEGRVGTVQIVPSTAEPQVATPCPTTDERVVLIGLLRETNARLDRQLGQALEDAVGMPLAWLEVLLRVSRSAGGFLSMSELAEQTVYSSGGTTRLIDRIEAKGLVERVACPNDRRAVHVKMTVLGEQELGTALHAHLDQLEQFVTSKLTREERAALEAALRKLNGGGPACVEGAT